jgi:hypothetical protein
MRVSLRGWLLWVVIGSGIFTVCPGFGQDRQQAPARPAAAEAEGAVALLTIPAAGTAVKNNGHEDKGKRISTFDPAKDLSEDDRKAILEQRKIVLSASCALPGYCGLDALKMVFSHYRQKHEENQNPAAEDIQQWAKDNVFNEILRFSGDGTTVWDLVTIAKHYGYTAQSSVKRGAGPFSWQVIKDLKARLDEGIPPIVAIRNVFEGQPGTGGSIGDSHFAVIEGFHSVNDTEYMVVKHNHSESDFIWKVADFEQSWDDAWRATCYVRSTR